MRCSRGRFLLPSRLARDPPDWADCHSVRRNLIASPISFPSPPIHTTAAPGSSIFWLNAGASSVPPVFAGDRAIRTQTCSCFLLANILPAALPGQTLPNLAVTHHDPQPSRPRFVNESSLIPVRPSRLPRTVIPFPFPSSDALHSYSAVARGFTHHISDWSTCIRALRRTLVPHFSLVDKSLIVPDPLPPCSLSGNIIPLSLSQSLVVPHGERPLALPHYALH